MDPLGLEVLALPNTSWPSYTVSPVNTGLLVTGLLSTTDGATMVGTWIAATFGAGSFNVGLGVVIGIETSPALFGGIFEMYHGLGLMYEAFETPDQLDGGPCK